MKTFLRIICLVLAIEMVAALVAECLGAELPAAIDAVHAFIAFVAAFLFLFVFSDYAADQRSRRAVSISRAAVMNRSPHALAA
jgi:hypothetical protein